MIPNDDDGRRGRDAGAAGAMRGAAALSLLALFATSPSPGCSDDAETIPEAPPAPTAKIEVTVKFPSFALESALAGLHLWVLAPEAGSEVTCSALVGGEVDPYDVRAARLADVAVQGTSGPLAAEGVPLGPALAYVEATDYSGRPELAGCVEIAVQQPATAAELTLGKFKLFDCADPETEEGAPCDDGALCTVGETCKGGACKGGAVRDCTHVADACNAESCDEELGCVATPIANDTPCDDGLFCTSGDTCQAGACTGAPRDCEAGASACSIAAGCDEGSGECVYQNAPEDTPCDDGLFCTENDACSFGTCSGSQRDCTALSTSCATGACDEDTNACVAQPKSQGAFCDDELYCTVSDGCDGQGSCTGQPRVCSGGSACKPNVCSEAQNSCVSSNASVGTSCDDLDACTAADACDGAGVCAGTPVTGDPGCP